MKNLNVKDLVYSHKANKPGFITSINDEGYFEIQHPFEWSVNKSQKENDHERLLQMSVAEHSELTLIKIK